MLIVDDEAEVTEYLREVLTKDGFAVDAAATAESALALALTQSYTLILTDINMPGMGGRGLYEAIRREAPEAARRIGFITGDTMSPQVRSFLDAARRPYLEKPVVPGDVRRLAREMLGANTTAEEPS